MVLQEGDPLSIASQWGQCDAEVVGEGIDCGDTEVRGGDEEGRLMRRISDAVRRDFAFALECEQKLGGMGSCVSWPSGDASALLAFKRYDCEGKTVGCDDPDIIRAIRGKASLNWHIAEWRAGIRERLFLPCEFREAHPWLPEWVWRVVAREDEEVNESCP